MPIVPLYQSAGSRVRIIERYAYQLDCTYSQEIHEWDNLSDWSDNTKQWGVEITLLVRKGAEKWLGSGPCLKTPFKTSYGCQPAIASMTKNERM